MRRGMTAVGGGEHLVSVVPDKRAQRARSGTHNHECPCCATLGPQFYPQQTLVVMGPRVRGDDKSGRRLESKIPHNSLALENANDDTRRVFSSKISVRVIGGSARWLQFSRSQSRQLTPIGVPSALSRSIPVA